MTDGFKDRVKATTKARAWNVAHKIGTEVFYRGNRHFTESAAALGSRNEAVVFINGVDEAVPLTAIRPATATAAAVE